MNTRKIRFGLYELRSRLNTFPAVREARSRVKAAWWVLRGHSVAYRLRINSVPGDAVTPRRHKMLVQECHLIADAGGR